MESTNYFSDSNSRIQISREYNFNKEVYLNQQHKLID